MLPPSSLIYHPSSAILTGRTERKGRKTPFCGRHLRDADTAEGREKGHFTAEIAEDTKGRSSPRRRRDTEKLWGKKMQGTSAEVAEKRGLWFVDYPSLI
jgi:hypothetical protein